MKHVATRPSSHFLGKVVAGKDARYANAVQLTPAATGAGVAVEAVGDDANIDVTVKPKGTGTAKIDGSVTLTGRGTVTQITSITTGVTVNAQGGTITTVAASAAAGGEHTFTVTNSKVAANDFVGACIKSYAGAGTPFVGVTAVAAGSFGITITNLHATVALDAALEITFAVAKIAA